jgi:hypothetical protein
MKKAVWSGIVAAAGVLFLSGNAFAQVNDAKTINVTVNVNARAKLTLGTAAITFGDQDPDTVPTLTSAAVSVNVKARTTAAGSVTLTMIAGGDFANAAGNTIDLATLTWAATGTNFVAGATSKAAAQSVGSWTGSGEQVGTNTFSLPNSWSYAVGSYSVALNYTLTAP